MEITKEVWKDIPHYECLYEVSNYGRVRAVDRIIAWENKNGTQCQRIAKGHIVPQRDNGHGYQQVQLWKFNKGHIEYVHRLVAMAFIPNPDNKPQVDHIDTDRANNVVTNLRWVNQSENNLNPITNNKMHEAPHTGAIGERNGANTHPEKNVFCNGTCSQYFKGTHYYNNGVEEVRAKECPEGFVEGRLSGCFGRNK